MASVGAKKYRNTHTPAMFPVTRLSGRNRTPEVEVRKLGTPTCSTLHNVFHATKSNIKDK